VKRVFVLYNIQPGSTRGGHAHRLQHQLLLMPAGSCTASTEEKTGRSKYVLSSPREGLYVPPLVWIDLCDFSTDAVCLVLASDIYDEGDYIRDYNEFTYLALLEHGASPTPCTLNAIIQPFPRQVYGREQRSSTPTRQL
jgi:hypothetical protein